MKILFFNINGSGLGHMNRCLAYAKQLYKDADIFFFSLASACEIIESFDFSSDYFVSHFWSAANNLRWNCELSHRFSLALSIIKPDVIVFDGTWPYCGFLHACKSMAQSSKLVWSNRGLMKINNFCNQKFLNFFDLVIEPGELECIHNNTSKFIKTPPVTLLNENDFFSRNEARKRLMLSYNKKYVLFSLGPGNLKKVDNLGYKLILQFLSLGYQPIWALSPITINDTILPPDVIPLKAYPIAQYMRAFDVFVGAAGYNTCHEVVQSQVPTLLIPNTLLADDQKRRAELVAKFSPTIISPCSTDMEIADAVLAVHKLSLKPNLNPLSTPMNGANVAAKAILSLHNSPKEHIYIKNYRSYIDGVASIGNFLYRHNLFGWPRWTPALKHSNFQNGQTLYITCDLQSKEESRIACTKIKHWLTGIHFVPVLETGISDFSFYSRLGFLIEYLPNLDGNMVYITQKKHYLRWRYRGAKYIPLSSGLCNKQQFLAHLGLL